MAIKFVVCDIDGTLVDFQNHLSKANQEALLACEEKGIEIMLASGRSATRIFPYVEILQMDKHHGHLIEYNGISIFHLENRSRDVFGRISRQEMIDLCLSLWDYEFEMSFFFDGGLYFYIPFSILPYKLKERKERNLPDDFPWTSGPWAWNVDMREGNPELKRIYHLDELDKPFFNKLNLFHDPAVWKTKEQEVKALLSGRYEALKTCPRILEIAPKGISKGHALKNFMESKGLSKNEVIVFGDGENDIPMFNEVHYSCAMANSEDIVKAKANYQVPSNEEDGVAYGLHQFILDV